MSGEHEDYPQPAPKCIDCGGHRHVCEKLDAEGVAYCRLKRIAYEFCGDLRDCNPAGATFIKHVAELLRETEDEAVERLSVARTKRITELEVEVSALRAVDPDDFYCDACGEIKVGHCPVMQREHVQVDP